jgi:serine/threonine-protein kinase
MVRLDHPHVLRVFELGIDQGRSFVVMELADTSLQDRLDWDGPLPPSEVVSIGIQLLSALSAAHAAGVIHRDIKPHNLLLCGGRVVLADFGIASITEDLGVQTRTGMMMGSLAYMPPEQRLDARSAGPRSDIYAVGSTLYALLTGGNPVDLFAAPPSSPRWLGIPPPLLTVLQRACAYEPSDRYPDAAAMAAALKEVAPQVGELPAVPWPEVPPTHSLPHQPTSIVAPPPPELRDRRRWWPMLVLPVLIALLSLPFLGEEEPVVPNPAPAAAAPVVEAPAPLPLPVSVEAVKEPPKNSNDSVICTAPSVFQGSWELGCGLGSVQLILGEKACRVTVNKKTQTLRAEEEGSALRLWVGNSKTASYTLNGPTGDSYRDGGGFESCVRMRSVVGRWSGSYGDFRASLDLKGGG